MLWVQQWNHGKKQIVREGVVITVRFRLGSARLDNEDPTNRHLGWVSYVSRACQGQRRRRGASKDVETLGKIKVFIAA